ncbi:MAG TPA: hypothetical protein VFZ66_08725 [Herpetosiphonaceae bacterium]
MPQRLLSLLIVCLLLVGCGSARQTVTNTRTPAATSQSPTISPTSGVSPTLTPAPQPTATVATAMASADTGGAWQTYTNEAGGYSLSIPTEWGVSGEPAASVQFFDQERSDLADLGTGEPEYFAGGVEILGLIASEPDPYLAVLPNQSAIVDMRPIETPLGAGRVYTLRRDRFKPLAGETVWYAQHALIPVGSRIYELWVRVDATTGGDPVPTLRRMLEGLRVG